MCIGKDGGKGMKKRSGGEGGWNGEEEKVEKRGAKIFGICYHNFG